jgi:hypothetical protein
LEDPIIDMVTRVLKRLDLAKIRDDTLEKMETLKEISKKKKEEERLKFEEK